MSENQVIPPPLPLIPRTSGKAIASLVFGILAISILPIIGSIIAIITGYFARKEIRSSGGLIIGDGMALAGIIIGWASVWLIIVGFCVSFILALLDPIIGSVFSGITEGL
jgi:hypothetical protein